MDMQGEGRISASTPPPSGLGGGPASGNLASSAQGALPRTPALGPRNHPNTRSPPRGSLRHPVKGPSPPRPRAMAVRRRSPLPDPLLVGLRDPLAASRPPRQPAPSNRDLGPCQAPVTLATGGASNFNSAAPTEQTLSFASRAPPRGRLRRSNHGSGGGGICISMATCGLSRPHFRLATSTRILSRRMVSVDGR